MPIFEYECENCGKRFEELMSRTEPDPSCPVCDTAEVTRLLSSTSFRLKGTGWYTTDYPSTSKKGNGGRQDSSDSADGGNTAEASTASPTEGTTKSTEAPGKKAFSKGKSDKSSGSVASA